MTARRVGDFVVYIIIGVAFALAIAWGAIHSSESGAEIFGKWGGLLVNTLIVFGYTIRYNRPALKRSSFWAIVLIFLALHLLVFIVIFERISEWRVLWWVIVTPAEYFAIGSLLIATGHRRHSASHRFPF
jgi:hypothetical protein